MLCETIVSNNTFAQKHSSNTKFVRLEFGLAYGGGFREISDPNRYTNSISSEMNHNSEAYLGDLTLLFKNRYGISLIHSTGFQSIQFNKTVTNFTSSHLEQFKSYYSIGTIGIAGTYKFPITQIKNSYCRILLGYSLLTASYTDESKDNSNSNGNGSNYYSFTKEAKANYGLIGGVMFDYYFFKHLGLFAGSIFQLSSSDEAYFSDNYPGGQTNSFLPHETGLNYINILAGLRF